MLSGCSAFFSVASYEHKFYQLPDNQAPAPDVHPHCPLGLVVRDGRANPFINSHKIIFASNGYEQGFYQFGSWVEPPPKRISALLITDLDQTKLFDSVSHISDSARGDLELSLEIQEFYHDTKEHPGTANIKIDCDLLSTRTRKITAHRTFSKSIELKSYSADGAVEALAQGTEQVLNEIVDWLAGSCDKAVEDGKNEVQPIVVPVPVQ